MCKTIHKHTLSYKIYQALTEPDFMYCCSVWDGLSQTLNNKLQKVQKPAARIITKSGMMLVRVHF